MSIFIKETKLGMKLLTETEKEALHIAGVSRSFSISYYFDGGCETVINVQATSKSDAIKKFWKQISTADRIHLIYDSFENIKL